MENVLEQEKESAKAVIELNKKECKIFGFSIWRLLAYFIIYSILGYAIETVFGLVTKGVLESRKSFLYGPFCGIYGIGAIFMIVGLQYFKRNNYTLFFGGFIIGSVVEYAISLIGEFMFHIKWWDYSDIPFNMNGRICILFSFFWGILAIYLMAHVNPKIDEIVDRFTSKALKIIISLIIVFLLLDCAVTGFALKMFFTRLVNNYQVEIQGADEYLEQYDKLYENQEIKKIVDTYFNDEAMLMTFPNIKVTGTDGKIILVKNILKDLPHYYFRVYTPKMS